MAKRGSSPVEGLRIVIYSLPSGTASFSKVIVKSNSSQTMGQVVVESKANVHIYIYICDLFTCCTTKSAKFAALGSSTDAFDCKYSVTSEMCTFIRSSESLPERNHICVAGQCDLAHPEAHNILTALSHGS